jgi:hypothetical protein
MHRSAFTKLLACWGIGLVCVLALVLMIRWFG